MPVLTRETAQCKGGNRCEAGKSAGNRDEARRIIRGTGQDRRLDESEFVRERRNHGHEGVAESGLPAALRRVLQDAQRACLGHDRHSGRTVDRRDDAERGRRLGRSDQDRARDGGQGCRTRGIPSPGEGACVKARRMAVRDIPVLQGFVSDCRLIYM